MSDILFREKAVGGRPGHPKSTVIKIEQIRKEGAPAIYSGVMYCLLKTYATGDAIAKMDAEILRFAQRPNMTRKMYAEALLDKVHGCHLV